MCIKLGGGFSLDLLLLLILFLCSPLVQSIVNSPEECDKMPAQFSQTQPDKVLIETGNWVRDCAHQTVLEL